MNMLRWNVVNDRCFVFNNLRYNLVAALVPPFHLSNDTDHGTGAVPFKADDMSKESIRESKRKYDERNRERKNAYLKLWRILNPKKLQEINHRWAEKNTEKHTAYRRTQRARRRGSLGVITEQEWNNLKERYNFACLCCGRQEPVIQLTLDHVLPLDKGGLNVIENAQPLCKSCNSKKHTKHIDYRPQREGSF